MDTTRIMAVSIKGRIRMEEAAAAEVEQWLLFIIAVANRAVIFLLPPLEFEAIVARGKTFVNETNTTY